MTDAARFRGAFLGAACGDALGYPIEKLSVSRIVHHYGPFGLRTMVRKKDNHRLAIVSDDTQMILATADGLLWSAAKDLDLSEGIYRGYMRWFYSQTGVEPRRGQRTWMRRQPHEKDFCLAREKFMHVSRNPGHTCLTSLANESRGTLKNKLNNSKGSGAVTRVAPIGLFCTGNGPAAFELGIRSAVLTHSAPTAYYAAGAGAALIAWLASGLSLPKSLERVLQLLHQENGADEVVTSLEAAVGQAESRPAGKEVPWSHLDSIRSLGTGSTANEALAIAVYCALAIDDPFDAVIVSANHDGASDTTATMCGAVEGTRFGTKFIPQSWLDCLEAGPVIQAVADKLYETYRENGNTSK